MMAYTGLIERYAMLKISQLVLIPYSTYNSHISAAVLVLDISVVVNDDGVLDHGLQHFSRTCHWFVVGPVGWLSPPLIRVPGIGQPQVAIGQSQIKTISLHA